MRKLVTSGAVCVAVFVPGNIISNIGRVTMQDFRSDHSSMFW